MYKYLLLVYDSKEKFNWIYPHMVNDKAQVQHQEVVTALYFLALGWI
jgi:hypothetical protein